MSPRERWDDMGEADSGIGYDGGCGGAKKRRRKAAAGEGKRVHVSAARSALIGVAVAAAYINWGLILSIQPSFYPSEAEKKGATPGQYGFTFGIVHLAAFVSAPAFAKYGSREGNKRGRTIAKIGPKLLYNLGGLVQALAALAFGFIDRVEDTTSFLLLSYLLRGLGGLADAASWGAVIGILMVLYPDKVASIMAWTEMTFGLGYTIGPFLGSQLYQLGGFDLPFLVVGAGGLFVAGLIFVAIPNIEGRDPDKNAKSKAKSKKGKESESFALLPASSSSSEGLNRDLESGDEQYKSWTDDDDDEEEEEKPVLTFSKMAKHPSIFMSYIDNMMCFVCFGLLEAMLEPYLKKVGYFFLLGGLFYVLTTPIAGKICDHVKFPVLISLAGNLCLATGLTLVAPVPGLGLAPWVNRTLACAAVVGTGQAFIMISSFTRAYRAVMKLGFSDDIETYLMISGVWSFSFFFGNFVGPTVGGFTVGSLGFARTTLVYASFQGVMLGVNGVELLKQLCGEQEDSLKKSKKGDRKR